MIYLHSYSEYTHDFFNPDDNRIYSITNIDESIKFYKIDIDGFISNSEIFEYILPTNLHHIKYITHSQRIIDSENSKLRIILNSI